MRRVLMFPVWAALFVLGGIAFVAMGVQAACSVLASWVWRLSE